ncbi:MAG: hypothetical protein ACXVO9_08730, partial [Bacteroidia bacterium]
MNTKTVLDKDYSFYVIEQHENVLSLNVLTENISLRKKGFCILPYQNPLVAKPIAKFYETGAEEIIQIKDLQLKANEPIRLQCAISKQDYIKKIKKLKEEIQKGNIYEINYCIEFYTENVEIDPLSVYLKLDELTK